MLLLLASAQAADLELSLQTSEDVNLHVTFHDIEQSSLPVLLPRDDLRLEVEPIRDGETWRLTFRLFEVARNGKRKLVSQPTVLVPAEQEARVRQGDSAGRYVELRGFVHEAP